MVCNKERGKVNTKSVDLNKVKNLDDMDFNITVLLRACASFAEGDLKYPPSCFSRGARAVQLRDGRQHPGPDGHVAQGQQAGRRRPRRQGQGAQRGHVGGEIWH